MRHLKFREFQEAKEAKEKGLATEPAGKPNNAPDGGKGPAVGKGFGDQNGLEPNKEKDGGKGANVGKGLGDEKGVITKDQAIPKEGKTVELIKIDSGFIGKDYKGFLATKYGNKAEDTTQPYADKADDTGVYLSSSSEDPKKGLAFDAMPGMTATNSGGEEPKFNFTKKNIAKLTSEEFLKDTQKLSPTDFVNYYAENTEEEPLPTITDLNGNQFTPDPNQTIEYLAHLAAKNPRLMTRFVREIKRHEGGFNKLFSESADHPEFVTNMVESMSKPETGKKFCHRIARGMNDTYMTALDNYVMENRLNEEVQPKKDLSVEDGGPVGNPPENPSGMSSPQMKQPQGGAFGGGGPAQPNLQPPGGAMGGGGPAGPSAPPPGGAMGGGGAMMGGQATGPAAGPAGMGGIGGGPPSLPPTGFDAGGMQPPQPTAKLKGETAHGNMIESMGGFPHMHTHMASFCINGNCDKK
jgi:hypothetical protein